MSGVKAKKRKQPDERQKNDLLRVLKALAPNHFSIGTFETHVSNNFKNLKNKASISLSAVEGLKDLVIPPKALVNVAGGGVVLQCKNPTVEHSLFALKVTRYSLFATRNGDQIKQLQEETDKAKAEYVKQASLSHLNVARVLRMTTASIDSTALPLITAEWIDGALGLNESLLLYSKDPCYAGKEHVERHKVIISILIQCFEGLAHLHSRALIHWDIKSGNLLVDKFGIPRIIDLGNSHYTYESPEKVETSLWNLPPDLAKSNITHDDGDSQRVSIELGGNKWNTPYIDLYMLGRELNRLFLVDEALLQQDEEYQRKHTTRKLLDRAESQQFLENIFPKNDEDAVFARRCIHLIINRLIYPASPDDKGYYDSAEQVAHDLSKIQPEFGAAESVSELRVIPQHVIRLPRCGNVPFTPRVDRLFNSRPMQRLAEHFQLATIRHVYPGATHRRNEHVLGVFGVVLEFVRALYADRTEPFWRLTIEQRDVEALMLAALLHDIGHIAFGHYLEDMTSVFRHMTHEDYLLQVLGRTTTLNNKYTDVVNAAIEEDRSQLDSILSEFWGNKPDVIRPLIADIIRPAHLELPEDNNKRISDPCAVLRRDDSGKMKIEILHSIIDGTLDADKLDYLLRDAHHCGIDYAKSIDLARLFQSLTTVTYSPHSTSTKTKHACVAVSEKGISPVESIMVARYQMFSHVYWQHTARAETAMLQYLVLQHLIGAKGSKRISGRGIRDKLNKLISEFLVKSDEQALRWLAQQLCPNCDLDKNIEDGGPTTDVTNIDIIKGLLGDRSKLYWQIYKMPRVKDVEKVYDKFVAHIAGDSKQPKSWENYIQDKLKFCRNVARILVQMVPKLKLRSIGNGQLLVDVPPPGRDETDHILVHSIDGTPRFDQLSAFGQAVGQTFEYWARCPRVFAAPDVAKKFIEAYGTEQELQKACHKAICQILNVPAEQMLWDDMNES